jgi:hypothetical protein
VVAERSTDRTDISRRLVAAQVEKAIGKQASATFDEPGPIMFAKGVGSVELARFVGGPERDKGVLLHIRTHSVSGQRVDLVLFGSLDNMEGWRPADGPGRGWYSSSWYAIAEMLEHRGLGAADDDAEYFSVEALKIALGQGITGTVASHAGQPWTRGWTLGRDPEGEWFAEIYTDVTLTQTRWNFHDSDPEKGAERILVGAPLWVRTASPESVVRYADLRRTPARGIRRLLPGRWRRAAVAPASAPPSPALESGQPSSTPPAPLAEAGH